MKISLKWLCDHVDVSEYAAKSAELAKLLTAAGLEVEATQDLARQFQNVVVGHILKLDKHPNADRLTVCQAAAPDRLRREEPQTRRQGGRDFAGRGFAWKFRDQKVEDSRCGKPGDARE